MPVQSAGSAVTPIQVKNVTNRYSGLPDQFFVFGQKIK
jgi:hypothetical protein